MEISPSFEVFSINPNPGKEQKQPTSRKSNRQPNPYFLFCQERRAQLQAEHPNLPSRSITGMLAKEWHNLSEIDRQTYTNKYIRNMEFVELEKQQEKARKKLIMLQIPILDGKFMSVPAYFP